MAVAGGKGTPPALALSTCPARAPDHRPRCPDKLGFTTTRSLVDGFAAALGIPMKAQPVTGDPESRCLEKEMGGEDVVVAPAGHPSWRSLHRTRETTRVAGWNRGGEGRGREGREGWCAIEGSNL